MVHQFVNQQGKVRIYLRHYLIITLTVFKHVQVLLTTFNRLQLLKCFLTLTRRWSKYLEQLQELLVLILSYLLPSLNLLPQKHHLNQRLNRQLLLLYLEGTPSFIPILRRTTHFRHLFLFSPAKHSAEHLLFFYLLSILRRINIISGELAIPLDLFCCSSSEGGNWLFAEGCNGSGEAGEHGFVGFFLGGRESGFELFGRLQCCTGGFVAVHHGCLNLYILK